MTRAMNRWAWLPWCGVLSSAVLMVLAPVARAQTRFVWPTREPAYGEYDVEECAAAVQRTQAYAAWGARYDTLTVKARLLRPEPPIVVEAARQCTAHLVLAQLPATAQPTLLRLWLVAGENSTFIAALHALAAHLSAPAERAARLADAAFLLLDMHPIRLALADSVAQELDRVGGPGSRAAFGVYMHLLTSAHDVGDDALGAGDLPRALHAIATYAQFDSVHLRSSPEERAAVADGAAALQRIGTRDRLLSEQGPAALLDSLRHDLGAQAGANHLHGPDSAGVVQVGLGGGGRPAPPIEADFWFGRPDSTAACIGMARPSCWNMSGVAPAGAVSRPS